LPAPTNPLVRLAALVAAFAAVACAPANLFTLKPDDPRVPPAMDGLARASQAGEDYDALLDYGWAQWMMRNDSAAALDAFARADAARPDRPEAAVAQALVRYFRGEIPASQERFLAAVARAPDSEWAELATAFVTEFYEHTGDFPERVTPVYEALIDDPRLSLRTRLSIVETLARLARERGEMAREKQLKKQLGAFHRWTVVGPFGEFGLLDFDRDFGPETAAPLQATYDSANGPLTPVVVDSERMSVRFSDLSDYGGVFYAVAFVRLERETDVVFRLVTRDLAALYIDDGRLIAVDPRQGFPAPLFETGARLSAGWHKVVVKLGDQRPQVSFQLQFVGPRGEPIDFEQADGLSGASDYPRGEGPRRLASPRFAERAWEAEAGGDARILFLASLAWFQLRDHNRIRPLLERALAVNPNFAPLYILSAFQAADDPTLGTEIARDRARADLRRALELDPLQALADYQLVTDDAERERIEEAIGKLKALETHAPAYYLWPKTLFEIYNARGWEKEAEAAARRAFALNDRNLGFLDAFQRFFEAKARFAEAEEIVRRIDRLDGPGDAHADWLEAHGDLAQAEGALKEAAEWEPAKEGLTARIADLAARRGDYPRASSLLSGLAERPGGWRRHAQRLAEIDALGGRPEAARAIREATLKREPGEFRTRAALAMEAGKELLPEYVTDGDAVIAAYRAEPWREEAGALVVLDEYITELFADGSSLGRTHIVTRVATKDAQTRYGEVSIPAGAELYALRVVKADGRVLIPEQFGGKSSVTMPELEPGDFIEYDYVQGQEPDTRLPGGRLFASRFIFRNIRVPTYRSNFTVVQPADMAVTRFPMNYELAQPTETAADGKIVVRYLNRELDEIVPEPFMPLEDEVLPMVAVSLPVNWEEVRNLWRQRLAALSPPSDAMRRFLALHRGDGERETVEKLYFALLEAIDGDENDFDWRTPAARVLSEKKGSRLLLLHTVLELAGIDNAFVLVRPQNVKEIPYPDATLKAYDELLLRVRPKDGDELYLNTTYRESIFAQPSPILTGGRAMVLDDGPETFVTLPTWSTANDDKTVDLRVKLLADGGAEAKGVERIGGYYSTALRRYLKKLPADQIPLFFEMILNRNFPGTTLVNVNVSNLDDTTKSLELVYTFRVQRLARRVGNRLRIERPFFPVEFSQNYIRTPTRSYPLLVNGVNAGKNVTVVELPPGFVVEQAPKTTAIESPFGSFRLDVKREDGALTMTREFMIPIQRVELPQYFDFYKFCSRVDQLEQQSLEFLAPAGIETAETARRSSVRP